MTFDSIITEPSPQCDVIFLCKCIFHSFLIKKPSPDSKCLIFDNVWNVDCRWGRSQNEPHHFKKMSPDTSRKLFPPNVSFGNPCLEFPHPRAEMNNIRSTEASNLARKAQNLVYFSPFSKETPLVCVKTYYI